MKTHNKTLAYIFLIFGFLGLHRFYLGKPKTGLLYSLTLGLLGIGWIIDFFLISKMVDQINSKNLEIGDAEYTLGWLLLIFTGIFGLHKLYLSKAFVAGLYFFTGGLFGFGLLYDFFTYNKQLSDFNKSLNK
jgi:TM2 domain-containing membrane protein YozV